MTAAAPELLIASGTDPSAVGRALAWQLPGGGAGIIQRTGAPTRQLPGSDPALGPQTVVWRDGDTLVVAAQDTLTPLLRIAAPGAEEPAISARWVIWRARESAGDVMRAIDLLAPDQPAQDLRRTVYPNRLGRPSIDGNRAVLHVATRAGSWIEEIYLPTRRVTVLRNARDSALLLNPSALHGKLLYVQSSPQGQEVLLGPRHVHGGRADKQLYVTHPTVRRDPGHEAGRSRHGEGYPRGRPPRQPPRAPARVNVTLWTTALAPGAAYVTRIRRTARGTATTILALSRSARGRTAAAIG